MRAIVKKPEPRSLIEHRLAFYAACDNYNADYDNFSDKVELRQSLVSEQRGLCCYCMSRIRSDATAMKIEHWQCQTKYQNRQLEYQNLLGACIGGEGLPPHLQHCDTRKGDLDLKWNPADPAHQIEAKIKYDPDGTIRSDDTTFDMQLNDVLNLNLKVLMNNRKSVLSAVLDWWKNRKSKLHGPIPKIEIQREIQRRIDGTGDLEPFSQVAVWWLKKKL